MLTKEFELEKVLLSDVVSFFGSLASSQFLFQKNVLLQTEKNLRFGCMTNYKKGGRCPEGAACRFRKNGIIFIYANKTNSIIILSLDVLSCFLFFYSFRLLEFCAFCYLGAIICTIFCSVYLYLLFCVSLMGLLNESHPRVFKR